jgi:peptidoglycan hydrolase-like protein with peptidoglycan-binding domain
MARDYTREEVLGIVSNTAQNNNIPRDDFLRFAYIETGGRFDEQVSRGPNGAKGLFQFVPSTAAQYGIAGRELDAVANTDAAARLYLDNQRDITNRHNRTGAPYLSGEATPNGLDMYMAHQQGAAGYASIQQAISSGSFGRGDTRGNILNNVSSRDMQAITGMTRDQFSQLSDKDMAKTFVQYWDTKFDRISIPEVGIEARTAGQQPATPANPSGTGAPGARTDQAPTTPPTTSGRAVTLNDAYDMGIKYDDVRYGLGAKNLANGKIDCAGWVKEMQNATMTEINRESGRAVFSDRDKFNTTTSDQMIKSASEKSGVLLTSPITRNQLKEGMIIGENNGKQSWEPAGRFNGIDHITMVVKNPANGELMISQSRGGNNGGVEMIPLDRYLQSKQARGVELFATDPLAKARSVLDGQQQNPPSTTRPEGAAPAAPNAPAARPGAMSDGMLKFGEKGPEVERAQVLLNRLGYVGADGKPLAVDKEIGPNTLSAVQKFQNDHGIKDSGIIGPKTLAAMAAEDQKLMTNPSNPNNAMYKEVLGKVQAAEAERKIASGPHSEKLAAALTVEAIREGITKVDRVELNTAGTSARVVQVNPTNDLPPLNRNTDSINVAQAMKQPVRESSEQAVQVANNVQVQQQDQQRTQTPQAVGGR